MAAGAAGEAGAAGALGKPRVAVVDDEVIILESWSEALRDDFRVELFSDPLAAKHFFESQDVDVALLDIRMPGLSGIELLQHLRRVQPQAEALIITGHGTISTAVEAIKQGAYDFLCKPIEDLESAIRRIQAAAERSRLRQTNADLRSKLEAFGPETKLIGKSRALEQVRAMIARVAAFPAPVLISGESGTGKELAARALHALSERRGKPFVAVNCAAIAETLIESELFGHERGAFTGAMSAHKGLFEAADGAVLFLDEIGDIPLQTQVRLLRALQEGEIRPVGSTRSRRVDTRVIVATNADLQRAMRAGTFREDLYYRISTFHIAIPALRERREDIPLIAQHLLDKFARRTACSCCRFADEALAALVGYAWPGNVRELGNAIEHAATLCDGAVIDARHLPAYVTTNTTTRTSAAPLAGSVSTLAFSAARTRLLEDFERRYLTDLLSGTSGNLSEAARRSGIDRSNLRRMLRRHNIAPRAFKDAG